MTVLAPAIDEIFSFVVFKSLSTNPAIEWSNSYEIQNTPGGSALDLREAMDDVVAFEQKIHLPFVRFTRIVASTWEEDSSPYDPESFVSVPLALEGLRDGGASQPMPLALCYHVRRVPTSGRNGKLFFRGVLTENDVESPSGRPALTSPTAIELMLQAAVTTDMQNLLPGGLGPLRLVMVGPGNYGRIVNGLSTGGVSLVPHNHEYYDLGGLLG